jgi:alpha-D-glucose phosphate-specific phosphoglucomutase
MKEEGLELTSEIKFGTDGWRAVMCDAFTFANVRLVIQAVADHVIENDMRDRGVLVGYDARFLSPGFANVAAEVLAANKIPTLVTDRDTPTPAVAFTVADRGLAGAVMFTASHNPPEYNGVKWIPHYAGPADPVITKEIEGHIARHAKAELTPRTLPLAEAMKSGIVKSIDPSGRYMSHIQSLVNLDTIVKSHIKIVCDPLFSTGRGYTDRILKEAGCDVETIHAHRDPLFGGGSPDPSEGSLAELRETVIRSGADLGLATDGDADRFGAVDSDGTYLGANQTIPLLLLHLLRAGKKQGAVVRTIATTHLIDRIARAHGIDVVETPVGFKYICQVMRERNVIIGGEESGGLSIGGHVPEKDGILANLLLAEFRAVEGRSLCESLRDVMKEYGTSHTRRVDLEFSDGAKRDALMRRLMEKPPMQVAGRRVRDVSTVDGVRFGLDGGDWFLVRASGTEPVVRFYAEADSDEGISALLGELNALLG